MRYMCAACGKTLDWEGEEARFCPFCGRAYAAPAAEGVRADAVQAKYWQLTRAAYWEALDEMADVQIDQSRKKGRAFCLERLTEAPSKEQAKREIDRGLAMIAKRLNVPKETERDASIDAIDALGGQLMRILGGEMPENELPQEDEKPKDEKKQYAEAKKLLDALTRTQATLKRLIDVLYIVTQICSSVNTKFQKKIQNFIFFFLRRTKGENKANSPSETNPHKNSRNLPFTMIPAIFIFL